MTKPASVSPLLEDSPLVDSPLLLKPLLDSPLDDSPLDDSPLDDSPLLEEPLDVSPLVDDDWSPELLVDEFPELDECFPPLEDDVLAS